jgi:hypothetical protein
MHGHVDDRTTSCSQIAAALANKVSQVSAKFLVSDLKPHNVCGLDRSQMPLVVALCV